MNQVIIRGRLSQEVEVRYTKTGKAVATFSVAVSRGRPKEGEKELTDFIPVQCWQGMAESAGNLLAKGNEVCVMGSWRNRSYEASDGQKRRVTELAAEFIGTSITNKVRSDKSDADFGSFGEEVAF